MYLKGKAYVWFHVFLSSHSNADWGLLTTEVCKRFDLVAEEAVEEVLADEEDMGVMQISLDTLMGSMKHKMIRIPGRIKGNQISILIDSGSTHSLIDERLVKSLGYTCDLNKPLGVIVANGQMLESGTVCPPLIWQMQGVEFQYKLRSLKLGESDMVLGVNWLSQFEPITFDFIQGHISFVNEGIEVTLSSEFTTSEFEMITGPQMNSLMVRQAYGITGQLCAITKQEVMNSYDGDSMAAEKIQSLIIDPASDQEYKYYNGVLRYKGKESYYVWVCEAASWDRLQIFEGYFGERRGSGW
ncbi:Uncharacterized protein Adt_41171 [Abeliophyllum distichum]|uniref:Uncharacterized protein n=1 Tax=Abeliophyllum distichum TaxID=126358 RepID=A0ABD1PN24_9LAMI